MAAQDQQRVDQERIDARWEQIAGLDAELDEEYWRRVAAWEFLRPIQEAHARAQRNG